MTNTFTDEELTCGMDIRNPKHRAFLIALQEERQHTGESFSVQLRRYKQEGRVIPDSRSRSGARLAKLTIMEQMENLKQMYAGATIKFGYTFLGEKGILFSMRGRPNLELCVHMDGRHRILEVTNSGYSEVYSGSPDGAVQVINRWYQG